METIRVMAALAAVPASLGAALWFLRRRTGAARAPGGRRLERLERLPLSPQHTLHLIRLGERILLVASSPGGCALLESQARTGFDPHGEARP
jgi:flagellar biogenesis protein FliO